MLFEASIPYLVDTNDAIYIMWAAVQTPAAEQFESQMGFRFALHLDQVRYARIEGSRHVVGVCQHLYANQQLHRAHAPHVQGLIVEVSLQGEEMAQDTLKELQASHGNSRPAALGTCHPSAAQQSFVGISGAMLPCCSLAPCQQDVTGNCPS